MKSENKDERTLFLQLKRANKNERIIIGQTPPLIWTRNENEGKRNGIYSKYKKHNNIWMEQLLMSKCNECDNERMQLMSKYQMNMKMRKNTNTF